MKRGGIIDDTLTKKFGDRFDRNTKAELNQLDSVMPKLIASAIRSTRSVSTRDHIKASRIERVNLFITDLRRQLTHGVSHLVSCYFTGVIYRKDLWIDAGVVSNIDIENSVSDASGSVYDLGSDRIRSWAHSAMISLDVDCHNHVCDDMGDLRELVAICKTISASAEAIVARS